MRKTGAIFLALCLLFAAGIARAEAPAVKSLFDPSRHMRVSEVKPGMKGYGLSVFSGTKIERFDVEVVDVVHDFNPKYDVVLIRCPQQFLKDTGPIAGMSGSPVYLYDQVGRARMIGAFAYGWPYEKDCLAGVQPIQYMLDLPSNESKNAGDDGSGEATGRPNGASQRSAGVSGSEHARWSLDQVPLRPWGKVDARQETAGQFRQFYGAGATDRGISSRRGSAMLGSGGIQLQPLATPLMAGGASARTLARISSLFEGTGLVPMQVGGGTGSEVRSVNPKLEPGSVLAIPLLTGDMELTAVGTCTERIGDRIFGFGHPFNGEGIVNLPMGAGSVATIVSNLETSFKLGFLSQTSGALLTDQTVGVAGTVGRKAPMIPLQLHVVYDDGSVDETYHFQAVLHPKLTPAIASAAIVMALTGEKNLPQYHTVDYDLTADFANGQSVHITNASANGEGGEIVNEIALPLMAASDNPFKAVPLTKLDGTIRISHTARSAQILSVMVAHSKYEPGEVVKAYISYEPFHAQPATMEVELPLPHDLPNGGYQFIVSDWTRYLDDERTANPFKFNANNIGELFTVVKDVMGIRHDAVYLRLVRQADGIAVGHTAMPHLPSSQRQVLMDAGRSDITPFVTSTLKTVPSNYVMSGSAEFTITIEKHGKVEVTSSGGGPEIQNKAAIPGANPAHAN